jgi:ATP-dependent DNA helicase RecG
MLTQEELKKLIADLESDRVERTTSINNTDKFSQAVCAFANDYPNHRQPGYLLIGIEDKTGNLSGLNVTDILLRNLGALRSAGNILPIPALTVTRHYSKETGMKTIAFFNNKGGNDFLKLAKQIGSKSDLEVN